MKAFSWAMPTNPLNFSNPRLAAFTRFLIVGGSSAVLSAMGLHALIHYLEMPFRPATLAVAVIGNCYGFVLNRQWTFMQTQEHPLLQMVRYTVVTLVAILLSVGLMTWLVEFLGLHYVAASLLTSAIFAVFNFLAHLNWTFHPKHGEKPQPGVGIRPGGQY